MKRGRAVRDMKQAIKVIITVAVALVCCFVMLASIGYFIYQQDSTKYDVDNATMAVLGDVQVEELGKTYQGYSQEGAAYYLISISLENPGNAPKEDYSLYFSFLDDEGYSYNRVVEINQSGEYISSGNVVIPAGMTGVVNRVLRIDDDCKSFTIKYRSYITEQEQTVEVNL